MAPWLVVSWRGAVYSAKEGRGGFLDTEAEIFRGCYVASFFGSCVGHECLGGFPWGGRKAER